MRLPRDKKTDTLAHTLLAVYVEMFLQICRDYSTLPDPRSLTMHEIRFYFEGVRAELVHTTGRKK